jgi:PAS domain S-box-containing protein
MNQSQLLTQNQLLHAEIKKRVDHIAAISMVTASVGNSLNLDATLNIALEAVTRVLGSEAAGISLIDEKAQEVVLRAQLGWLNDFVNTNPMRIPLGKGMSGTVINHDTVVLHNNLNGTEEYAVPSFHEEHFRSIVMAPMHAGGRIIGILSLMSNYPDRFDDDLVSVLRSIADTVGVAIENARLHEQHIEQENRLKAILHSTADGIIATDQDNRISLINQAAAQLLAVERTDLLGVSLRDAKIHPPVRDRLLRALGAEDPREMGFQVMLQGEREISVMVSPVRSSSQFPGESSTDGWVIVLQDMSHIRQAELARVRFIQAAAHDMKNPLAVTQKSIHMLEQMLDVHDETLTEVLNIARSSIDRVQKLIDDLLNIEKIESGYDFTLDEVDIREMCYEISAEIAPLLRSAQVDLETSIAPDVPPRVLLDRHWMQRALHNYLENAAKYAPHSKVRFALFMADKQLHFEVSDNGPGIPLRAQSRIFDRFYRIDQRRDVRGSGLGLAIVKSVAEAHQGNVYVRSQEGEGSTFGLAMPLAQEDHRA